MKDFYQNDKKYEVLYRTLYKIQKKPLIVKSEA